MKAITWFNESNNSTTAWDFTTLCIFCCRYTIHYSKAVGGSLQRYHPAAFAVSRSVFRDLSWHSTGLDEHINLSSVRRHSTILRVVKSSWKYTCFITIPNVLKQEENSGENPKTKKNWGGKKDEVKICLSFEAIKWEGKTTDTRVNSPKRDNSNKEP